MTVDDAIPDRDLLRARASRRLHLLGLAFALIVVAVLVGVLLLASPAALISPLLVLALLALVPIFSWRHVAQDPPLLQGADAATQRAVTSALKTGHASDPRIDALARNAAERSRRTPWVPWAMTAVAVLAFAAVLLSTLGMGYTLGSSAGVGGFGALTYGAWDAWRFAGRERRYGVR